MSSSVTTRRKPRQTSTPSTSTGTGTVDFQSVLRIRPLKKAEKDDMIVLEPSQHHSSGKAPTVALLHPIIHMTSPEGKHGRKSFERDMGSPMFIKEGEELQFHFDSVLDTNATQDKVHYSIGLNMARDAMDPLKHVGNKKSCAARNHLVVSMGVCNTGKTYTSFGSQKAIARTSGKHSEDGLVLRILESLYSQSQHHIRDANLSFAVRINMLYVQNDKVFDMLTNPSESQVTSSASKRSGVLAMVASFERGGSSSGDADHTPKIGKNGMEEVKLEQDLETHCFVVNSTPRTCRDVVEARETLQSGLKRGGNSGLIGGLVGKNNRGHTLVTIQPVLVKRDGTIKHNGGSISVLDMAGIERVKKSRSGGGAAMRDSIAINSSVSAVMHCLRTVKHNNDVVSGESRLQIVCDDDVSLDSDISNVSELKASKPQRNLKKVPYLQSKLTMLLQPILASTNAKKSVTMLLAAYPGPRDYAEKKSLLCDIELLRGASFTPDSATKKHTVNSRRDRKAANMPLLRANTGTKREQTHSESEDEKDENNQSRGNVDGAKKPGHPGISPYTSSSTRHTSMLGAIKESPPSMPTNPSAPTASVLGVDDVTAMPPPFAPMSQSSQQVKGQATHISAASEMSAPRTRTPHSRSMHASVSSTPEVEGIIDSSPILGSSNAYIRSETMPSPPLHKSVSSVPSPVTHQETLKGPNIQPEAKPSASKHSSSTVRATVAASPNIKPPSKKKQSPLVENKSFENKPPTTWIKESPMKTFNKVVHASKKKGKVAMQKVEKIIVANSAVEGKADIESEEAAISTKVHTANRTRSNAPEEKSMRTSEKGSSRVSEKTESEKILLRRLKDLEMRNARLCKQNAALDEKCEKLLVEKDKLTELLREARRSNRKTDWTALDEEEFHKSRRLRLRDQQLIRSPLRQHLEDVDVTYDIHGRWVETGKRPFHLQFPSHWTRAPDLDRRDRAQQAEGTTAPPPTPTNKPQKAVSFGTEREKAKTSNEKRKLFDSFQAVVKENKKLKFDLAE